ncbi:MAG: HAMP domain-containing protein [Burkholderiales bacterium]|nr:HAMP domain-containing protein [Opitutaceae bacterium]
MKAPGFNTRLALWIAALVLAALTLFAAAALAYFRHEQFEQVNIELADFLGRYTSAEALPGALPPFFSAARFDAGGRLVEISPGLPEAVARRGLGARSFITEDEPSPGWRVGAARSESGAWVVAAYRLTEVREVLVDMVVSCLVVLPVFAALAAWGAWWVSHRALDPLRKFTTAATEIAARRLDRRVPEPAADDDLRRLALAFNGMLERLEAGFDQAQRFAADASHELRTPLTIMRGEISRLLRAPGISPEVERKLASLQEEIGRLERISEHLLLLASFDAGQQGARHHEPLDFSALVREACEDAEVLASARDVRLRAEIADTPTVRGDPLLLRRLVLNLLDNATRYNLPDGEVACVLREASGRLELRVRNMGPGVPAEARARVFQRFFRADAARVSGGHGLGLALAREIARSHGGELVLAPDPAPGLTEFLLTLPVA